LWQQQWPKIRQAQATIKAAVDSANAAIASNQIAVTTSEQELRAYVTAFDVHMLQHRQPGTASAFGTEIPGRVHTYEFSVILKNGGQTPAINLRTNISLRRFQGEVPADFNFPDSDLFGYGLIGPQLEWRTRYNAASAGLIEEIGPPMLLWGWVEYDDIFTSHRAAAVRSGDAPKLRLTGDQAAGLLTAFALLEDVSIPVGPVRHHQLAMGGVQMFESWDWWR
jgi:hypothetical protein